MDLYRLRIFNVSNIKNEDMAYIDMHEDNHFPDEDEDITYIKSDVIEDTQYIFLLSDSYKINKLINLLDGKIRYKIDNVSLDFIKCKNIDGLDLFDNKYFFNNYRLNNLNIDDILDKINECGIDKLDDIDIKILKRKGD